ncbi:MAG TPA: geranylgeranyl reductase family protein [Bacillota bacterium]|nr:geranylgeranyl reductase family protein [Peptococcaceae bacterium MAG4]NLW38103.1 geranylgeranyl reductase family protein [Peptococcaceae bacterium]HPZ43555.1 geranylgeranyl reductase family protein [Bacillota bacterium]HQD76076.1 geranylgeranyl reductase family protein [Bacillota bacterium]HUM58765.1 geranylgeranyl reductase family protein [Bacillota bacterium]
MSKYDVIVVGGGPAGAVAARECARLGLETVLLEKEFLPRPKTCAGAISAAAMNLLDVPIPPEIIEARCSVFHGFYGDRQITIELEQDFIVLVSRDVFDLWLVSLAQAAGAEVRQGQKVIEVDPGTNGVIVRTSGRVYTARLVIGADGVYSTVARAVRKPFLKKDLAFCVCSEIGTVERDVPWQEGVEVYYGLTPVVGYRWIFPKRNRVSTGLGVWPSCTKHVRAAFLDFLKEKGLAVGGRIRGGHIPLGGISRPAVSDGIILAGDAAGFADPFTGEGIRYAIASGRLAAATATSLLSRSAPPNRQNLGVYERNCYHSFGADLKAALFISRLFQYFPRILLGMFFNSREPFAESLQILNGCRDYRQLYRWLLWHIPGLLRRSFSDRRVQA